MTTDDSSFSPGISQSQLHKYPRSKLLFVAHVCGSHIAYGLLGFCGIPLRWHRNILEIPVDFLMHDQGHGENRPMMSVRAETKFYGSRGGVISLGLTKKALVVNFFLRILTDNLSDRF